MTHLGGDYVLLDYDTWYWLMRYTFDQLDTLKAATDKYAAEDAKRIREEFSEMSDRVWQAYVDEE